MGLHFLNFDFLMSILVKVVYCPMHVRMLFCCNVVISKCCYLLVPVNVVLSNLVSSDVLI